MTFADKYHIDELQNDVVNTLHAKYVAHEEGIDICFETLEFIVEHARPQSLLRRLFVDMLIKGISIDQFPHRVDQIPTEFLRDMYLVLKARATKGDYTGIFPLENPLSTYYASGSACETTIMPQPPLKIPTEIYPLRKED